MAEGIAEVYLERLNTPTNNAGVVLTKFFSELYDVPFDTKNVIMFNQLVKLYGRRLVFNAVLEIDNIKDYSKVRGLLQYICKKHLNEENPTPPNYLDKQVEEVESKIRKAKKAKLIIRSPFDA